MKFRNDVAALVRLAGAQCRRRVAGERGNAAAAHEDRRFDAVAKEVRACLLAARACVRWRRVRSRRACRFVDVVVASRLAHSIVFELWKQNSSRSDAETFSLFYKVAAARGARRAARVVLAPMRPTLGARRQLGKAYLSKKEHLMAIPFLNRALNVADKGVQSSAAVDRTDLSNHLVAARARAHARRPF